MQYLRILSNALEQCTAHTLFRNTHPLLMVMQNTKNSTQHITAHHTTYTTNIGRYMYSTYTHVTSPTVHTTHSVAGGPKARLGITLNLDGILIYSIVMYMYMYVSLQEWDLRCTIFTSVVSKICLLVLNLIVSCHVCQTRGGLNSQKTISYPKS